MAANQNGQLVLQTLQNLEQPSTITKISKEIADAVGVDMDDVKDSVQQTLDGGVRFGYVQRSNNKYYSTTVNLSDIVESIEQNEEGGSKIDITKEMQERARRSKRRRRGGRRRSRSRRRRRR